MYVCVYKWSDGAGAASEKLLNVWRCATPCSPLLGLLLASNPLLGYYTHTQLSESISFVRERARKRHTPTQRWHTTGCADSSLLFSLYKQRALWAAPAASVTMWTANRHHQNSYPWRLHPRWLPQFNKTLHPAPRAPLLFHLSLAAVATYQPLTFFFNSFFIWRIVVGGNIMQYGPFNDFFLFCFVAER